ncbi:T9SS type A sorting domain-containing protein [Flavobacteriales bacterium]|nr:T9SS type A sorting domain-containing protein [Flavobacteriales bacterium]
MMRFPLILLLFFLFGTAAHGQTLILSELCNMPSQVLETSGLENGTDGCFWTHNDSGNAPELFCIDTTGVIQRQVQIIGDANTDWEDLAKDNDGNMFIGNFGNNALNRTDLRIVKVPSIDTCTSSAFVTDTIRFSYPDQYDFPPEGDYGNFDMEAMVWYQDSLHLFSKDRSNPSTGYCKHYKLPSTGGDYVAELVDSLYTGSSSFVFSVTSADLSENNSELVLLNSERIWLCTNFTGSDFFDGDVAELVLGTLTQKEGICFRNGFMYVTDEDGFVPGGKLYRLHPDVFVGVGELSMDMNLQPVYNQEFQLQEIGVLNQQVKWQLINLDGKLVKTGTSFSSISATEFQGLQGMHVLKISSDSGQKAMLLKL